MGPSYLGVKASAIGLAIVKQSTSYEPCGTTKALSDLHCSWLIIDTSTVTSPIYVCVTLGSIAISAMTPKRTVSGSKDCPMSHVGVTTFGHGNHEVGKGIIKHYDQPFLAITINCLVLFTIIDH